MKEAPRRMRNKEKGKSMVRKIRNNEELERKRQRGLLCMEIWLEVTKTNDRRLSNAKAKGSQ